MNDKLGYVSAIRYVQFICIQVSRSNSSKKSTIVFVDMPDCERMQTNIIDYQKIYEMTLVNNSFTALADLLAGYQKGSYTLQTAPYEQSKLTMIIRSLLAPSGSSRLNLAFLATLWPTDTAFHDLTDALGYISRFTTGLEDPSNLYNSE